MGRVGNAIGHSPRHQPGLDLFVVDAQSWPEDGGDEAEDLMTAPFRDRDQQADARKKNIRRHAAGDADALASP